MLMEKPKRAASKPFRMLSPVMPMTALTRESRVRTSQGEEDVRQLRQRYNHREEKEGTDKLAKDSSIVLHTERQTALTLLVQRISIDRCKHCGRCAWHSY